MSALSPGSRLGPYEVVAVLGAGGMGEVYRGRDTRLGREVAIKVLPRHLSNDAEVRARFEREARTVSGLNHPNICTLYDVGREGDTDYLVMELIDGETLATRLTRGALPTADVFRFGAQIADALDRAHRAGVVHRDLKPGNVMLTRSGAKLMDFGLARATGLAAPGTSGLSMAALTQSPTVASPLTAEGTIVGTFQYMSPEQLEGREADARSDLWALGCVLYEMATGRRPFEGRSQASLITSIMGSQPAPITRLAPMTPPAMDQLISGLLAKDPEDRLQTAHDAKLQLQWAGSADASSSAGVAAVAAASAAPTRSAKNTARLPWAIAVVALAAAVGMLALAWPRLRERRMDYRFRIEPRATTDTYWPRVSPDGRTLLFETSDSSGTTQAWIRPMNDLEARPIPGSERLTRAYWSPDGREIAFVADGKLERLAVTGGTPLVITAATGGADLSWGSHGDVLMDGRATDSLRVVPARGGELRPATRIDRAARETGSAWPCFLPDGEHFLFIGIRSEDLSGFGGDIRLGRLGSLDSKLLGHSDGRVEYAPGGWVLYLHGATLLARRLDVGAARLIGEPITIAENVRIGLSSGHFSVGGDGTIAVVRDDVGQSSNLQSMDRAGRPLGAPLTKDVVGNASPSPDGHRILFQRRQGGPGSPSDVWVRDLDRGTETRLTFTPNGVSSPVWSPDGRRFACTTSGVGGAPMVLIGSADGAGAVDSLKLTAGRQWVLSQWAAAGSRLVLWGDDFRATVTINTEGPDRQIHPLPNAQSLVGQPALSPDGRWLAITSAVDASSPQIFVTSVTGPPGRWQISTLGGINATWVKGGRELIYEQLNGNRLMSVSIDTKTSFAAGIPRTLLVLPAPSPSPEIRNWWPTADGERIYVVTNPGGDAAAPIEVMTDFAARVNGH
ncbi:MAG: protein kinase [Candidatus Eisenbacteria bacterium]